MYTAVIIYVPAPCFHVDMDQDSAPEEAKVDFAITQPGFGKLVAWIDRERRIQAEPCAENLSSIRLESFTAAPTLHAVLVGAV